MTFHKSFINKFIAFVDKEFTYDSRLTNHENCEFFAINRDTEVSILIYRLKSSILVSLFKKNECLIQEYLETPAEVNRFKKIIKLIG